MMPCDYDRRWATYNERSLALLRPLLGGDLGDVLDLACGTGNLLPRLGAVRGYVGVDRSPEMLLAARRKFPAASLAAGDGAALPFADARFDTVVCVSALHVFPEPERALAEVRRVLRRPGRLLLVDWTRDAISMRALGLWLRLTGERYRRMYSLAEATERLQRAGFRVASAERHAINWPWALLLIDAAIG
jgi:ubiquinone/menaquinone biosynthesis C-methylase UbiE